MELKHKSWIGIRGGGGVLKRKNNPYFSHVSDMLITPRTKKKIIF